MKKTIIFIFLAMVFILPFTNVSALDIEDKLHIDNSHEFIIQEKIDAFLKEKRKDNIYSLTPSEELELVNFIENYKNNLNPNFKLQRVSGKDYATSFDITGYIFLTMDSRTSGWRHGHAGIGYSAGGNVIEANPGDGVELYYDRVKDYWSKRKTGGIYSVKKAEYADYKKARNYAKSKLGRKYGFNPFGGDFYCSELVYYAWKEAGYNVASSRVWGTPILPSQIMNDGDTVKEVSFPFKV